MRCLLDWDWNPQQVTPPVSTARLLAEVLITLFTQNVSLMPQLGFTGPGHSWSIANLGWRAMSFLFVWTIWRVGFTAKEVRWVTNTNKKKLFFPWFRILTFSYCQLKSQQRPTHDHVIGQNFSGHLNL